MSRGLRHSSEKLANILNSQPYPGQAEDLKRFLTEGQENGFPLTVVINYNIPRYNGRTLVHIAANNGLFGCLEELLRLGGDTNAISFPSDLCQTPLHLAASKGRYRCLQVLLENNADMFIENSHRVKASELVSGKKVCEKVFQHAIAKVTIPSRTREQQQRVVDMHQYVEDGEELHLFYSMYEGLPPVHMDLATRWNDLSQTLLYRACSKEILEVVQCLLSRSSNEPLPNLSGSESPLHIACERGNHKIVQALLNHSPKLMFAIRGEESTTALHTVCDAGDLEMVRIFCDTIRSFVTSDGAKTGALPPDVKDKTGRTPFFMACCHGYAEIITEICRLKEDLGREMTLSVNAPEQDTKRTPLHVAVASGNLETVKILLTLEEVDKNIEAQPSPKTHEMLLRNIETKRHGRLLLPHESIDFSHSSPIKKPSIVKSPTDSVLNSSPSLQHCSTMQPLGNYGRGGDAAVNTTGYSSSYTPETGTNFGVNPSSTGVTAVTTNQSNFTVPVQRNVPSPKTQKKKLPKPRGRTRTITVEISSEGVDNDDQRGLAVFLNQRDELVVGKRDRTGGTIFSQLKVTPLAEACALGHTEIATQLLKYGGQDSSGLACRIAHLTQEFDLMQQMLSRSCTIVKQGKQHHVGSSSTGEKQIKVESGLKLSWNAKKLPEIKGEWFSDNTQYYLDQSRNSECEDYEEEERENSLLITITNLKRVGPLRLRQLTPSEMPLSELNLSRNNLRSLPFEIFQLEHLIILQVQYNRLVELPESEGGVPWHCPKLEQVNLAHNNLLRVPACLWTLPMLRKLCLSHNKISTFAESDLPPKDLQQLSPYLTQFEMNGNSFGPKLPSFIFEFASVERVYLANNKLEELPDSLWYCPTLQELSVTCNELASLPLCNPESDGVCPVDDSDTGYTILHQSDKILTGVVQVKPTACNPYAKQKSSIYRSIKPSGGELSWVNYCVVNTESYDYSKLKKLDLSKNKLPRFPEALPCLAPNLMELNISHNPMRTLDVQYVPESVKKMMCRNCEIEYVGNVIGAEEFKQVVRVCRCPLEAYRGTACQHRNHPRLNHLTSLDLSHNKIKHFQLIHRNQQARRFGDDPGNQPVEKQFQPSLSSLDLLYPALENLNLSHNDLRDLFNPNIGHQTHLKSIKLSSNPELERIPYEFSSLKKSKDFTELAMANLPKLHEPPAEYQTADLSHILTYMRSCLKESVPHRTIKLFLIGNGERGKTTLLRRLRGLQEEKAISRTEGIDIEDWNYPQSQGKLKFSAAKPPVHFLAWDFAGQDVYHTTHQCFYSRRSLYLALFRLTDGEDGIKELDHWLRNVKLRAPGSVVVIVGTHMDMMKDQQEIRRLEQCAMDAYTNSREHPKVVSVMSVSAKQTLLSRNNNIEKLRLKLYDIACHLQVASDGVTLEYKEGCREDAPKCLFQIQIPKTFLNLQDKIRETVVSYRSSDPPTIPIMEEEEFKQKFKDLFDDEEEMNEAVFYLNLQGTILHFEDHGLRETYFLDPQWLAKLMASIIHPSAEEGKSPIKKGMGEVCDLFQGSPDKHRKKFIKLLEKFEVALQLTDTQVIIPSLMPTDASYPKPNDSLHDIPHNVDSFYQPPMRRFWLAAYIPEGFWPRLICRIATDPQIGKTLRELIRTDPKMTSAQDSVPHYKLNWIPWRSGIAFVDHGRTLLVIREAINEGHPPVAEDSDALYSEIKPMRGSHRVEVHVYAPEWFSLMSECSGAEREEVTGIDPLSLTSMATQLLIMISKHVQTLACDWFSDMLKNEESLLAPPAYLPCWKCYGHKPFTEEKYEKVLADGLGEGDNNGDWVFHKGVPVYCFTLHQSVIPAAEGNDLKCHLHGEIKIEHTAPDLVFCDLKNTSTYYQDNSVPLKINSNRVLGKGGYGFVCEGDLSFPAQGKKRVAVKIFMEDQGTENSSITELLERSKQTRHLLHAYREIRQEVAFLSALDHPHLTQLCGVRTRPNMCLLLELAPLGSLRQQLKDYHNHGLVLEPLTLKMTTLQIAKGLEFLHQHQIVHLDMKSPNVLVWHFPSANYSPKDRVTYAGNVWLKLADYGISQVSTGFVMRVKSNPVGTPGYMAPELFDQLGQQVSSEKVDVFGFGMTIYELLSLSPPFGDVLPPFKRNTEIRDRHRPLLKGRQTRSLVLLQELMRLCWEHDPDHRPRMSQIREWVSAEEFERLRADVALSDVHSISCACVSRISPENEEEEEKEDRGNGGDPRHMETQGEDTNVKYLPSVLEDSGHVDTVTIQDVCPEEDAPTQFLPTARQSNSAGLVLEQSYTQIWMCGRDTKKGLLHIFTYYDGQPGFHSFTGYCSKEEVSALCPVKNMMWMGTTTGTIKVFHAPTLRARFTGKLAVDMSRPSCILNILYIPLASCVLVSTANGDIWSFEDKLTPNGLVVQRHLALTDYYQCYHLVTVERDGEVEVWGTMDNSQLCLLERDPVEVWKTQEIRVNTGDPKLRLCSHIALSHFTSKRGVEQNHLWISYRSRGVLVAWDANERKQIEVINCNTSFKQMKTNKDSTFQVSTLAAQGKKVFFGTDSGSVGIIDSETRQLLRSLHWYEGKVRTLLVMPKEVEACICAEAYVPSPQQQHHNSKTDNGGGGGGGGGGEKKQNFKKPDHLKNPHNVSVNVRDRNAVMVTTFGNGRRKYMVHTVTRSERNLQFDKEFLHPALPATKKTNHFTHENISLLSWKS